VFILPPAADIKSFLTLYSPYVLVGLVDDRVVEWLRDYAWWLRAVTGRTVERASLNELYRQSCLLVERFRRLFGIGGR
jgi:hypothetical protein